MPSPTMIDVAQRSRPVAKFWTPKGSVSTAGRREAENKGQTMRGGSFPIRNAADLARAKHDVGRAKDPAAARRWINRRAKELGEPSLGQSKEKRRRTLYDHPSSKRS